MNKRPPIAVSALAVFAALISLVPLFYLLIRGSQAGLEKLIAELLRPRTTELLVNTFSLVVLVSITTLVIGIFQAWLVVRSNIRFRSVIAVVSALPLAIPSYISAFGYVSLIDGFSGLWGTWLVLSLSTSPYVYLAVAAALVATNVQSEEVARSLGKTRFQVIKTVTWPNIRPAASSATLLAALYALSDFGAPSILRFDTFTIGVYNAYRSSFDRSAAAAIALILVVFTLVILLAERSTRGKAYESSSKIKRRVDLGGFTIPSFIALGVIFIAAIGIPMAALLRWSLIGTSTAELGRLVSATLTTLSYGLAAGVVITIFALSVGLLIARYKSPITNWVTASIWVGHALPGIVVALSLVFLGSSLVPGIYQTAWLLVIAYLILYLPNALAAIKTPLAQIPLAMEEVASSLGKTKLNILRKITLPIALPGILAAGALAALTVMKELPATLLLRPTGDDTLSTRLWSLTDLGSFAAAAPYALMLVALGGIPALLLNNQIRKTTQEA